MFRKFFCLLSPDGEAGGSGAPSPNTPPPTATAQDPAPPPAATTVVTGTKSEREIALEEENARLKTEREELAASKKKVEMDAGQLQDEVRRLTTPPRKEKAKPETRSLRMFRPRND